MSCCLVKFHLNTQALQLSVASAVIAEAMAVSFMDPVVSPYLKSVSKFSFPFPIKES